MGMFTLTLKGDAWRGENPVFDMQKEHLAWRIVVFKGDGVVYLKKGEEYVQADYTKPAESLENMLATEAIRDALIFFEGKEARGQLQMNKFAETQMSVIADLAVLAMFTILLIAVLVYPQPNSSILSTALMLGAYLIFGGVAGSRLKVGWDYFQSEECQKARTIRAGLDKDYQDYLAALKILRETFNNKD
jgi:hypothetical protein